MTGLGSWTCNALEYAGIDVTACNNIEGRGTVGFVTAVLVGCVLIVVAARRFLEKRSMRTMD